MNEIESLSIINILGKYLLVNYITWNHKLQQYTTDYSKKAKKCMAIIYCTFVYFLLNTLFSISKKHVLSKADIIFCAEIPFIFITSAIAVRYPYVNQKKIIQLFENLNIIEIFLLKCGINKLKYRTVNKRITLISLSFTLVMLQGIISIIIHHTVTDLKEFTVHGIIGLFVLYHLFYLICCKAILNDEITEINKLLKIVILKKITSRNCSLCKIQESNNSNLCSQHLIM